MNPKSVYLRVGSDDLSDAEFYPSRAAAVRAFSEQARELAQYGQKLEASVHIADRIEDVVEYPDFVLSLGPRGVVKVERA